MNSFLKNIVGLFFIEAEQQIKPLMYAQLTAWIGVVIAWFLTRDNGQYYWMYLMLGTAFLLVGIENRIGKETKRKDILIWLIGALLFYGIAVSDFLF